ncbi:pyrroline-5-carboxylate reductase [Methanolinea mesophila]|uniref:pyrroline-5-carboxylate reductase family protein n=1 Tax=Methanolinea mesophila TaxID=547055 RepID=UPI001AEB5557|nr:NAD(P)-binding domain-containing protein [Methanolinea mesophila]MBP1929976.1 pyrroline-5-carboxylate reductase [Methanolinea mesophila]
MKRLRIVFIGGGRVVRIILGGWDKTGLLSQMDVAVCDTSEETLRTLVAKYPQISPLPPGGSSVARADIVVLAVHPPAVGEVLASLGTHLREDAIVVSLVPKITTRHISGTLGGFSRIARVIPNAPSIIGTGYNPVSFSPGLPDEGRARLRALFAPLGGFPEVPEQDLEAYAVITAMGPTYLWFQLYELEKVAGSFGLAPEKAAEAVEKMAAGAIAAMTSPGLSPEEVMDLVPVRPLAEDEPAITGMYRKRLPGLYQKLKG